MLDPNGPSQPASEFSFVRRDATNLEYSLRRPRFENFEALYGRFFVLPQSGLFLSSPFIPSFHFAFPQSRPLYSFIFFLSTPFTCPPLPLPLLFSLYPPSLFLPHLFLPLSLLSLLLPLPSFSPHIALKNPECGFIRCGGGRPLASVRARRRPDNERLASHLLPDVRHHRAELNPCNILNRIFATM